MERLTLREALASDRLEAFVRQEEAKGVELVTGSDLERALALLVTIRWSEKRNEAPIFPFVAKVTSTPAIKTTQSFWRRTE